MAKMENKLENVTFGVEIEFILAYRSDEQDRYQDEIEEEVHNMIRRSLELAGLQVHSNDVDVTDDPELKYVKWTVKGDDSLFATQQDLDCIDGIFANGVKAENPNGYAYLEVEVVSPVLTFCVEAMREVQMAMEAICTHSVFAPRSAGLHVHIGNGHDDIPLPFLKDLAVLTTCFEQQWNQAIPPHRLNNLECELPRNSFTPEYYNRQVMANAIYDMPDRETLIQMLHVPPEGFRLGDPHHEYLDRKKAINYSNLSLWADDDGKRTIEFRQQAGTVDTRQVLRWIITVGAMVGIANEYPPEVFRSIIQKHRRADGKDDWAFSLLELFKDFNVNSLIGLWEGHLYVHDEYNPDQHQGSDGGSSNGAVKGPKPWPKYLVVLDE